MRFRLALLALAVALTACSPASEDRAAAVFTQNVFDKIHRNLPLVQDEAAAIDGDEAQQ